MDGQWLHVSTVHPCCSRTFLHSFFLPSTAHWSRCLGLLRSLVEFCSNSYSSFNGQIWDCLWNSHGPLCSSTLTLFTLPHPWVNHGIPNRKEALFILGFVAVSRTSQLLTQPVLASFVQCGQSTELLCHYGSMSDFCLAQPLYVPWETLG